MSKAVYRTSSGIELELDEVSASRLFGLELVAPPKAQKTTKTNSSREGTK